MRTIRLVNEQGSTIKPDFQVTEVPGVGGVIRRDGDFYRVAHQPFRQDAGGQVIIITVQSPMQAVASRGGRTLVQE